MKKILESIKYWFETEVKISRASIIVILLTLTSISVMQLLQPYSILLNFWTRMGIYLSVTILIFIFFGRKVY